MDIWQIILYALASFWALRSLVSLMSQHRKEYRREVIVREKKRLEKLALETEQNKALEAIEAKRAAEPAA